MKTELAQRTVAALKTVGTDFVSYVPAALRISATVICSPTTATKTEDLLDTLGIQHVVLDSADRLEAHVKDATRMTHALELPVALVFTGEFTE